MQYEDFLREKRFPMDPSIHHEVRDRGGFGAAVSCQDRNLSLELWEYGILPFNWTTILGIRFGGYPILT